MKVLFSCVICVLILGVLCSCASQKESDTKPERLSYMPSRPVVLKNDSNERKIIQASSSLKEARAQAVKLGVIPFDQKTFPQLRNSIRKGSPVIIQSQEGLTLIVGEDTDKGNFIKREGKKLKAISSSDLKEIYTKAGRKASIFSEPWEVTQESDLYSAFESGLKMVNQSPMKARKVFEKLIELAPDAPEPYLALANTYESSESARAVEVLEEGVSRNPNEFALWYNLAAYQARSGQNSHTQQCV